MRALYLLFAAAAMASAQCYSFTAPGVTYTINITALTTAQDDSVSSNWIVLQQSTLVAGGQTYQGPLQPANIIILDAGGETSFQIAASQVLQSPTWQVTIALVGMLDYLPQRRPQGCRGFPSGR